jgi:GrpB-like predicted nucleotidyltransferase (UPF0157 family)
VGSTAVPGLDAKPVIDILAGIGDLATARPCIRLLAPLCYLCAPYRAGEMLWFCKPHPARRTHHLHLVPPGTAMSCCSGTTCVNTPMRVLAMPALSTTWPSATART